MRTSFDSFGGRRESNCMTLMTDRNPFMHPVRGTRCAAPGARPEGLVAMAGGAAYEAGDFIAGEDIGQGTNAWWLDHVDPREGLAEYVLIEEADAVAIDFDDAPGMGGDQRAEVAFEFVGGEVIGEAIDILRESANGDSVVFLALPWTLRAVGCCS